LLLLEAKGTRYKYQTCLFSRFLLFLINNGG
jgi:hypothetical protein